MQLSPEQMKEVGVVVEEIQSSGWDDAAFELVWSRAEITRLRGALITGASLLEQGCNAKDMAESMRRAAGDDCCRHCGGQMKPSKAIAQTWAGQPEWEGDTIYTMSPSGPGRMIDCMKCEKCGYSVTTPQSNSPKAA